MIWKRKQVTFVVKNPVGIVYIYNQLALELIICRRIHWSGSRGGGLYRSTRYHGGWRIKGINEWSKGRRVKSIGGRGVGR